ncbi:MAG: cellulose synthase complex periplasmic endoglucanase BcsZ [Sulfuricaulis sp.]|nr:cellulose synthase complex periplasmic endoglucanase BcsZ [Sulfuricaulis sp.]
MRPKVILFQVILWLAMSSACASTNPSSDWPEWNDFVGRFVQADGRVTDITFERKSTSEGQSYGLFFALVANDRTRFDTILKWTSDNLAAGQLGKKLPAWLWGLRDDGSWGVKDENSASDADLWIAYSLLEAARLWKAPNYADTGRKLLTQISRHEIAQAGSAGPVLLPGAIGFTLDKGRFRINPSYLPDFMFRYLAAADPKGPWQAVWDGYRRMAPKVFSAGVAPDLFVVDSMGLVMPDTEREPSGSYDAIRVYLWAGMSGRSSQETIKMLSTYAALIRKSGTPPEKVNPLTAVAIKSDYSPIGYSGAVLPFLSALDDKSSLEKQRDRVRVAALRAKQGEPTNYYDQVLILFGKGWLDGQYRFDDQGRLQPKWMR